MSRGLQLPPSSKSPRNTILLATEGVEEEYKVNSQIARLNAVAAKLRAEAAELEVSIMKM